MSLTATFTGIGVHPTVVTARARSSRTIEVRFSEPMRVNSALLDEDNYVLFHDGVSVDVAVLSVALIYPSAEDAVMLTVDVDPTIGIDNYAVRVDTSIVDVAGNTLAGDDAWGPFGEPVTDNVEYFSGLDWTVSDHCALGQARMLEQFKTLPVFEGVLCATLDPGGDIERAADDVKNRRSLDTAFGKGLDKLGELYKRPRNGDVDDDYRLYLKAEALNVSSRGHPDEIIAIISQLRGDETDDLIYHEHYPAGISISDVITSDDTETVNRIGERFAGILRKAKPAGVRLVYSWIDGDAIYFVWDGDDGGGWQEEDEQPDGDGGIWMEGV